MLQIQKIRTKARELTDTILAGYVANTVITPEVYLSLVKNLSKRAGIPFEPVWHCGRSLINKELTKENLYRFLYFVLVNNSLIRRCNLILDDAALANDEMFVRFAIPSRISDQKYAVPFEILSGRYAGKRITIDLWRGEVVSWLFKLGYKSGSKNYWLNGIKTGLSGLYAKLKVVIPERVTKLYECNFSVIEAPSITAYNQKNIIRYRNQRAECPHGFDIDQLTEEDFCVSKCTKSWEFCSASGHPYECEDGNCNQCGGIGLYPIGADCCLKCKLKQEYANE